jgi:RecA/RadA recombinase
MAKKKKPGDEPEVNGETLGNEPEAETPKKASKKADIEVVEEAKKEPSKKGPTSKAFEALAAKMVKKWGDNVAIASNVKSQGLPRISFGNFGLDVATLGPDGKGGVPQGRMTRLWGAQKSAKTGTALNLVAEWQKHCSICYRREECNCDNREKANALWVDTEGRTVDNPAWITSHGVDLEHLMLISPPNGEQVVDAIDAVIRDDSSGMGICRIR